MAEPEQIDQLIQKLSGIVDQWESSRFEPKTIELHLNPSELCKIIMGLCLLQCERQAQDFIRNSLNKGISDRDRWARVSEIMLQKEAGKKKLRRRGNDNEEITHYWILVDSQGYSANKAAEEVFKKFNFPSQEACNSWLRDEIKRFKREGFEMFGNLKKPEKSPK